MKQLPPPNSYFSFPLKLIILIQVPYYLANDKTHTTFTLLSDWLTTSRLYMLHASIPPDSSSWWCTLHAYRLQQCLCHLSWPTGSTNNCYLCACYVSIVLMLCQNPGYVCVMQHSVLHLRKKTLLHSFLFLL